MNKISDNIYCYTASGENSYLITGDVNILIDGVSAQYAREYTEAVEKAVAFSDIEYIVVNHSEPNRTGTLSAVLEKNPDIKVIGSTAALKFLSDGLKFNGVLAKDKLKLKIGGKELQFILTPYINWPDSMMTLYDGCLFSCDLFSSDEDGCEGYYNKYLYPYREYVRLAIEELSGYDIKYIFPGSGKFQKADILKSYIKPSESEYALILYSSVYGNTKEMAETVSEVLSRETADFRIFDIEREDSTYLAKCINNCKMLFIGANTINSDAPKKLWRILGDADKLTNKFKPCMIFGSYAWSGEGLYYTEQHLKMLRYKIFKKPFGVTLKMSERDREELQTMTEEFLKSIEV